MAYRLNAQFRDSLTANAPATVVDAPVPRRGETIIIAKNGECVPMRVIAIWTPSSKVNSDGLTVVEAREI